MLRAGCRRKSVIYFLFFFVVFCRVAYCIVHTLSACSFTKLISIFVLIFMLLSLSAFVRFLLKKLLACLLFCFVVVVLSRFRITKFLITETLQSSVIFKTIMVTLHRGIKVCSCAHIFKFFYGSTEFFIRGKLIPKITIFGDFGAC